MSNAAAWARAFARQAKANFETYQQVENLPDVPKCHKLHFLQMACEKLAKAHLCNDGSDPYDLQGSHAYIGKHLPIIARQLIAQRQGSQPGRRGSPSKRIQDLARQIEMLSPSVNDGGKRRDNCEYPWEVAPGRLLIPAEYDFPNLSLLTDPAGRRFLKIVKDAISGLL